jgi:SAM-dependent methyltransferase
MTPYERAYYLGLLNYLGGLYAAYGEDYVNALWGAGGADSAALAQGLNQALADYECALSGAAGAEVKLNLGSAAVALEGFTNVDLVAAPGVEVADLTKPWPWPDSSVDYVRASHVIEHLPDKILTMNELWRVLKPGARADIAVPTTDGPGAWQDPTHVSFWNRRSFLYYEDGSPYRELGARQYRIEARFRTVREALTPTDDGPILSITLEAVKE